MPPPDMPAALYANAVDAYCTGEPFGAAAQHAGYAMPLRMTRDEWRNYNRRVLTVREELIRERRPMVQDLVNQVLGAGLWLDAKQENRDKAVTHRSGPQLLQSGPEHHPVRDGESDGPGDLRRPAHDPLGVRGSRASSRSRPATIERPIAYETYMDEKLCAQLQAGRHHAVREASDVMHRALRAACSCSSLRLRRARPTSAVLKAGVFSPPQTGT